ncbi:MAG: ATP-dependent DNA helicase RecG [Lachnospiraceae bacterium]|jgi:ATP-dependent DNA helicase RecG|nr:ATP-dependent DNA helicase RecG [Lachnospiraceae bacterium]MCI9624002.1 ATP-dependent DNA helicase RecG [Lachnospiraceae bacterium]
MDSPITSIKGIGEKTAMLFHRVGVHTVGELLSYYPRTYDMYQEPVTFANLKAEEIQAVAGFLRKAPSVTKTKRYAVTTVVLEEFGEYLHLTWFNMPFLKNTLTPGSTYIFRGRVQKKKGRLVMEQPEYFTPEAYEEKLNTMQPIYGLTAGLSNKTVAKAVKQALDGRNLNPEYLPEEIRMSQELAEYNFALQTIHFPVKWEDLLLARKRLVFDEFFLFILALRQMKEASEVRKNECPCSPVKETQQLLESLPYELTGAQKKVWEELQRDLAGEGVMSRLIQGDVGSGKTVVALLALVCAVYNGYQGALMAPTEVLARQHGQSIREMLEGAGLPVSVAVLTGSMTAKEKRLAYEAIESGEAKIVVGTHALIQNQVRFSRLGLVVTDEQHRFGVRQRETLTDKGEYPHVLVMSATPIPRTLAIILYGDLDISVLDELPANRLPIKNCVVDESYRATAYRFMEKEIAAGRQVYVICAMVEENPELELENVVDYTEKLKKAMNPSTAIEYLHGKMKAAEKNEIMERFAAGEIQVLVSTTVVEVGVNVPNATVMMVENAERFGLAQLHQLRGRVGRGKHQSYCIFVSGNDSPDTKKRLEILNKSNDGFYIASEDLKLRGPGDLFGIRQSGLLEFRIGDVFTDAGILKAAGEAAARLLREDPSLQKEEHRELRKRLSACRMGGDGNVSL